MSTSKIQKIIKSLTVPTKVNNFTKAQITNTFKSIPLNNSTRYVVIVDDGQIVGILDRAYKQLTAEDNKLEKVSDKLIKILRNFLSNKLKGGIYVFDVFLNLRHLQIIDVFYANGEQVMEQTWEKRLVLLNELYNGGGGGNGDLPSTDSKIQIRILNAQPDRKIDFNILERNIGGVLLRDLQEFALFTKEYYLHPSETYKKFVQVGDALFVKSHAVALKKAPWERLKQISPQMQHALLEFANNEEKFTGFDQEAFDADNDYKLACFNEIKKYYRKQKNALGKSAESVGEEGCIFEF